MDFQFIKSNTDPNFACLPHQDEDDFDKYHTDVFGFRNMDPEKCVLSLINYRRIETKRFGSADIRYALLHGTKVGDYPVREYKEEDVDFFLGHIQGHIKARNIAVQNLKRLKYVVVVASMFTVHEFPDIANEDLPLLATYYLNVGATMHDDLLDDVNFAEVKDIDAYLAKIRRFNRIILDIMRLKDPSPEALAEFNYSDQDTILMCFKLWAKYSHEHNPDYPEHSKYLEATYDHFLNCGEYFLRHVFRESGKPPGERKQVSERTYLFMRTSDVGVLWAPEFHFLGNHTPIPDEIRATPQFQRFVRSSALAHGLINDMFSVSKEFDFETEYLSDKSFLLTKNLILMKMLEGMTLEEAAKYTETLYNSEVEDMMDFGNQLLELFPDNEVLEKAVKRMPWLLHASIRGYGTLKYRYGTTAMYNIGVADFLSKKWHKIEPVNLKYLKNGKYH